MKYCPKCGDETAICTSNKDGRKYHVCVNYPRCQGRVALQHGAHGQGWGDDWDAERPATHDTHDRPHQQRYTEKESSQHRDMDMEDIVADRQESAGRGLKWGPTCLGAFLNVVLMLAVVEIVLAFASDISETTAIIIWVAVALICYTGGGFLAGAMAGERGTSHGLLSGFIAWGSMLIITFMMGGYFLWAFSGDDAGYVVLGMVIGLLVEIGFSALGGFAGAKFREHWK